MAIALLAGCGHEPPPTPPPAPAAPLPEPRSLDEACARWKCRPETEVRLETPKGLLRATVNRTVYTDGKLLRLVAGETLAITGDVQGDQLVNLRLVESPGDTDVLIFHLEQRKLKTAPSMVLHVQNRFRRNVKYRASMQIPERKGYYHTSSCPVLAEKQAFEMWPNAIISLLIKDLRLVTTDGKVVCE
jgi:hypothetical protein